MKRFAVLLTVHNRKKKTLECLERLFASTIQPGWEMTVYMTDDGSTDGTGKAVKERFPGVEIVEGDGNLYWNRGMLAAWKRAAAAFDYDGYLWLNDDTVLEHDAISRLLEATELYPGSILVGATRAISGDTITYGGIGKRECRMEPDGTYQECLTMNGNIVLVTAGAFNKLGFLDPVFTHSTGDVDYGLTANENGIKVLLLPEACGRCDRNVGIPKWRDPKVPFFKRLRNLWHPLSYSRPPEFFHYKKKHWGLGSACLSMASIALNVVSPSLWRRLRDR